MYFEHLRAVTPDSVSATARRVERLVQTVAFWTATILPVGYLPLLFVAPSRFAALPMLGKLLSLNVIALVLGHGYKSDNE